MIKINISNTLFAASEILLSTPEKSFMSFHSCKSFTAASTPEEAFSQDGTYTKTVKPPR